jgi:hypothetical protein
MTVNLQAELFIIRVDLFQPVGPPSRAGMAQPNRA